MLREILACVVLLVSVSGIMVAVSNLSVVCGQTSTAVTNVMEVANTRTGYEVH